MSGSGTIGSKAPNITGSVLPPTSTQHAKTGAAGTHPALEKKPVASGPLLQIRNAAERPVLSPESVKSAINSLLRTKPSEAARLLARMTPQEAGMTRTEWSCMRAEAHYEVKEFEEARHHVETARDQTDKGRHDPLWIANIEVRIRIQLAARQESIANEILEHDKRLKSAIEQAEDPPPLENPAEELENIAKDRAAGKPDYFGELDAREVYARFALADHELGKALEILDYNKGMADFHSLKAKVLYTLAGEDADLVAAADAVAKEIPAPLSDAVLQFQEERLREADKAAAPTIRALQVKYPLIER